MLKNFVQCPITMCFRLRTMLKLLNIQDRSFGIRMLVVLRANGEVLRIQRASFVILLLLGAVHLELSPIYLAELFLRKKSKCWSL